MNRNPLVWNREPGHYEVYYLSLTDRASGWGAWIRSTMVAPLEGEATASLWFMAMHPDGRTVGRKISYPVDQLAATDSPFSLKIADSELTDSGYRGAFEDVAWDLTWTSHLPQAVHVDPFLERAKIAKTVLVLPHPDVEVSGTLRFAATVVTLDHARAGQAHLWGSKHANRWAWTHCNDFEGVDGSPRPDTFFDGVSVFVDRFGREIGPSTPVVGRFGGRGFESTSPLRVMRNPSRFGLTGWHLEAVDGDRKIVADVEAPRDTLVGVTYHDPDGDNAYCYNSEVATMRVRVLDRRGNRLRPDWRLADELVAPATAHFEYAQRRPLDGVALAVT